MPARTRNYATIVYPESAPANWISIFKEQHVPGFISPLHDSDVNDDGEIKKSHYHVMVMFENVKTKDQAVALFDQIGGVGCEIVQSLRSFARYLCHIDDPDKFRYSEENVTSIAGADYYDIISAPADRYEVIGEMLDYIKDSHTYSYSDLLLYARDERPDWFRCLCDSGTYVIKEYLKSFHWTEVKQE